MMIVNLLRSARRQLHTIISHETIKPSSPTPSHLHTYNLSELDLLNPKAYIPLLLFYPNNPNCTLTTHQKSTVLKKSLSQSLTQHYPFAGRLFTPTTPSYIDCNDQGVVFVEARNDSQLDTFQHMTGQDETLGQLFADGVVHYMPPSITNVVRVQVNHFSCGGLGVALSMSHLVGDACSLGSFLSHWASVARYGSSDHRQVLPMKPHFIHYPRSESIRAPAPNGDRDINQIRIFGVRRFVFRNSKLSELKNKVVFEAGGSINNPTRVEVLTSMLYTTAVKAAATKSGTFKPSYLFFMVNMRDKFVEKLPQTTIGNFVSLMMVPTRHTSDTSISSVVAEIKKQKLEFEGIQSVQQLAENTKSSKVRNQDLENIGEGSYYCSSLCGFPYSKLDFGWGKPMGTTLATKSTGKNGFVLMDKADGDGIEALVMLEEEHMKIFENDKEMLSYCQSDSI
ncbi:putative deacetylvindoline O-acetyltransferase [Helianthus annuus]|uniref:Deacetylvindoline O-acetyltransferase n=1 Tax=Helianthus annuus TaxID=4232 RepID=A0A251TQB8_HELAN|nr:tabersonine-19-hydroxy-O-acetyltransferase [Helianthus annuus]KAF5787466.1 putative deacetylvindoline O-acetyltransferase [Helianthus annuus]KAJ0880680.1 putative deacetylvindoline O-acetyltransferase [Helianthus annuus]